MQKNHCVCSFNTAKNRLKRYKSEKKTGRLTVFYKVRWACPTQAKGDIHILSCGLIYFQYGDLPNVSSGTLSVDAGYWRVNER